MANGQVRNITASIVESTFRMAVAHVCELDPVKDCAHLRRWSSHSLRVGACVILHGMGFTDSQIKARLVGSDSTKPLCVYRHTNGTVRYITASIIEATFRKAASHIYKLDPVKDCAHLRKWSAHSLRVGACVILHGMGFTDSQIQFLLRWRSNAFFTYLRNITGLAYKQNRAHADLTIMPNFI